MIEREERVGLIVYLYYNRDAKKLANFGDIIYHSKKHRYLHLYVNQENSVRLVRLTFDVVADKDSRFGWLVTSQPTESLYPG